MQHKGIIILSHETAFNIHRALRIKKQTLENLINYIIYSGYAGLREALENTGVSKFLSLPYEIVVTSKNLRNKNSCIQPRVSSILGSENFEFSNHSNKLSNQDTSFSFVQKVNDKIGVVCPEMVFLQLTQTKGPIFAMEAGLEMCGKYCVDVRNSSILCDIKQITFAEKIQSFLNNLSQQTKGVRSIKLAQKYAKYLTDNSASPQESKLYLKLALPKSCGGYGLTNLLFNYPVVPPKGPLNTTFKQVFYCDLANPVSKVAIEYDSKQFHSESQEIIADRQKKEVLQSMGWKVFTFTAAEVRNHKVFNEKAQQIALALNKRPGKLTKSFLDKQSKLFRELDV